MTSSSLFGLPITLSREPSRPVRGSLTDTFVASTKGKLESGVSNRIDKSNAPAAPPIKTTVETVNATTVHDAGATYVECLAGDPRNVFSAGKPDMVSLGWIFPLNNIVCVAGLKSSSAVANRLRRIPTAAASSTASR